MSRPRKPLNELKTKKGKYLTPAYLVDVEYIRDLDLGELTQPIDKLQFIIKEFDKQLQRRKRNGHEATE